METTRTNRNDLQTALRNLRPLIMSFPPEHPARKQNREIRRALRNQREEVGVSYDAGGSALDYDSALRGLLKVCGR
jgi:hypothetical protein